MKLDLQNIKKALLDGSYVAPKDLTRAEEFSKIHSLSLTDALLSLGLIKRQFLGQAMAELYGMSYANILSYPPNRDLILKIPQEIAQRNFIVAFTQDEKHVYIATAAPLPAPIMDQVKQFFPGLEVASVFAFPEDIEKFFLHYRKSLTTRFTEIVAKEGKVAPEITEEIIRDALAYEASDIHFEPQENDVMIRFRINGVLYQAGQIPKKYYPNVLNRIKILAQLRVDEHSSSQDGAIRHPTEEGMVDIRISIVPTLEGEKVAMRILSRHVNVFTLADIGLSAANQKILTETVDKPAGMIIVSGPTGSGKTTTLYTALKILNNPDVNITTIEDPVEYKIHGINQIQVNSQTGLTFAKGLRSVVRQDPDIILVGEIRDQETAEISINAALTGHLMLSTFHANDTATTIARMLYMDIEPAILASTLELVIAQRLIRKICESCRFSTTTTISEALKIFPGAKKYFTTDTFTLYKGKGCNACNGFGYLGRIAVFEFLPIFTELHELIVQRPPISKIKKLTEKLGMKSLFDDGIEKVKNGVTTLEELLRVAAPPED